MDRCLTTLKLGVKGRGEGKHGSKTDGCFLKNPVSKLFEQQKTATYK